MLFAKGSATQMGKEDMRAIGRIRGILGKHFLDLDELHINCSKGVVRILGRFRRLGSLSGVMPITERFLHDLKMEIKRLPNVRRVMLAQSSDSDD